MQSLSLQRTPGTLPPEKINATTGNDERHHHHDGSTHLAYTTTATQHHHHHPLENLISEKYNRKPPPLLPFLWETNETTVDIDLCRPSSPP
ncbi:unnamed protein product [Lactuca virosa]|uniref:Uncharacterized protein n=1 Tax=Lactuca virosa TaxID=75947 RepID=A0AAU9LR73_9ASTR|nr:unnamed protein product [Lactuca virosa]